MQYKDDVSYNGLSRVKNGKREANIPAQSTEVGQIGV